MPNADSSHRDVPVDVSFLEFDPASPAFAQSVRPIAQCYQLVYGSDSSWNEGRKCPTCSTAKEPKKWNFDVAPEACDVCGGATEFFWPIEVITEDMRHELALPHAVCVVARVEEQVVGAAWGFSASPKEMEDHLNQGLPEDARVNGVARELEKQFPGQRVAYQDEIFVHPGMQRLGIGGMLFRERHKHFVEHGLVGYVLRTKTNPPSRSFLWYGSPRWGYTTIGRYPDRDRRVIMAVSFDRLRRNGKV